MSTEKVNFPETLLSAIQYFADADRSLAFMVSMRWPDGKVTCPRCQCERVSFLSTRRLWKCKGCAKQFSVKVGTIFEDSPLGLERWLPAVWVIVNAKNGVSSCELARSLGVTQKTAWFMLHRIRLAMQNGTLDQFGGQVEVDETFIGGKARNMHADVKARRGIKTGGASMTPVMGLLERTTARRQSRVILKHVETRRKPELQGNVRKYVLKGSTVNTDELLAYEGLQDEFTHNVINHAECYAKGQVHVNGMENFWSLLKRCIKGTYVSVEPFHLFRYLDEQSFRFNERKDKEGDKGRFLTAMAGIFGKRLTFRHLTGADRVDNLPGGQGKAKEGVKFYGLWLFPLDGMMPT
ncbi:MAG TPA: IS1595 family transposase [Chthoniobacteraceae bacterium]|jgi:transposase-like protein|nr:IS1595 family transposase [Chthoniobacteraceae bacterium]